jgi:hypothetical protein
MIESLVAEADHEAPEGRLLAWRGMRAAGILADELLLPGDQAGWQDAMNKAEAGLADALAPSAAEVAGALGLALESQASDDEGPLTDGVAACWRIRRELATGGYLQARRRMDQLLLAYGPLGVLDGVDKLFPDPGELAFVLWTAAEIYLQGAPETGRVDMPGDLGD